MSKNTQLGLEHFYVLLLAGGSGTRLWPLTETPKPLMRLWGDQSLFRTMVSNLLGLFPAEQIWVVTDRNLSLLLMPETPELPAPNFFTEPSSRDTTAAIGLGIFQLAQRDPDATVAIISTDLHIAQPEALLEALRHAHQIAQAGNIVSLGIKPSYPATGFGYIQHGEPIYTQADWIAYQSLGFIEKPDEAAAQAFFDSKAYSWDSGMIVVTARTLMAEFRRLQPNIAHLLEEMIASPQNADQIWSTIPRLSFDYAIMEHAENLAVLPIEMSWQDVGTWDAIYDLSPKDEHENAVATTSPPILIDTYHTYVRGERTIAVIGVDDLVIIDTPTALLICKRDAVQKVRQVAAYLSQAAKKG